MFSSFFALLFIFLVLCLHPSLAYIPAHAVNGSVGPVNASRIRLQWFGGGTYWENVSYQLVGANSLGVSQGALVHFSEKYANSTTPPTLTPWVALVSCEANTTAVTDDEEDIFTLARDLGAVGALLYSPFSDSCEINAEYADPTVFDQLFDIFTTKTLSVSQSIEDQFQQLSTRNPNGSVYYWYNSDRLNDSQTVINQIIDANGPVPQPGYVFATLVAYNATNASSYDGSGPIGGPPGGPPPSSKSNSNLAMIVLYAITACVSALFILVIVSGAVRAIRHPERYGPRSAGRFGPEDGQTRAQGLTRAILDTFPIVKFGSSNPPLSNNQDTEAATKNPSEPDSPHPPNSEVEMKKLGPTNEAATTLDVDPAVINLTDTNAPKDLESDSGSSQQRSSQSTDSPVARPRPPKPAAETRADNSHVIPAAIGKETCPICIVDFEEGDDLRELPCEGKHRFHQQCVDPWLLELSSSCPICRHDFLALDNILSSQSDSEEEEQHQEEGHHLEPPSASRYRTHSHAYRFSRYIRRAIQRRRARDEQEQDPTDPYMPQAPVTTLGVQA